MAVLAPYKEPLESLAIGLALVLMPFAVAIAMGTTDAAETDGLGNKLFWGMQSLGIATVLVTGALKKTWTLRVIRWLSLIPYLLFMAWFTGLFATAP